MFHACACSPHVPLLQVLAGDLSTPHLLQLSNVTRYTITSAIVYHCRGNLRNPHCYAQGAPTHRMVGRLPGRKPGALKESTMARVMIMNGVVLTPREQREALRNQR